MSSRRFELLMTYLHFNDSEQQPSCDSPNHDKLYKIRPILDRVVESYQSVYVPSKNISIDESIIGFKGRLSWIQYIPKKPTKWGIKAWVLADSKFGYIWNLRLYTGTIIIIIIICDLSRKNPSYAFLISLSFNSCQAAILYRMPTSFGNQEEQ